jgi:hypothetical protein
MDEIAVEFDAYEQALIANNVEALDAFFWQSKEAIRFGVDENLYGAQAIAQYRRGVPDGRWRRTLLNTFIVTFGEDCASVTTEYVQSDGVHGRQSQMWARLPEGWRIVAAHVSVKADDACSQ